MTVETEYITSRRNPLMVQVGKLLSSRKHRRAMGMTVGDGTKLLGEAVRWRPEGLRAVQVTRVPGISPRSVSRCFMSVCAVIWVT